MPAKYANLHLFLRNSAVWQRPLSWTCPRTASYPERGGDPAGHHRRFRPLLGRKSLIYKVLAQLEAPFRVCRLLLLPGPDAWDRHWRRKLHAEEMRDARGAGDDAGTGCGERGLVVYAEYRSRFRWQRQ